MMGIRRRWWAFFLSKASHPINVRRLAPTEYILFSIWSPLSIQNWSESRLYGVRLSAVAVPAVGRDSRAQPRRPARPRSSGSPFI